MHVLNAPSPAATASLAIADRLADEVESAFAWELPAAGSCLRRQSYID